MDSIFWEIGLLHYLILSLIIFVIGLAGILVSRNMLRTVMSLLVISVSIVINFLAFGSFCARDLNGANIASVLVLVLSVIQAVAGFILFFKVYQANEFLDVEKIKD